MTSARPVSDSAADTQRPDENANTGKRPPPAEREVPLDQSAERGGSCAVALVAPTGRDGAVAERILDSYGIEAIFCRNMDKTLMVH